MGIAFLYFSIDQYCQYHDNMIIYNIYLLMDSKSRQHFSLRICYVNQQCISGIALSLTFLGIPILLFCNEMIQYSLEKQTEVHWQHNTPNQTLETLGSLRTLSSKRNFVSYIPMNSEWKQYRLLHLWLVSMVKEILHNCMKRIKETAFLKQMELYVMFATFISENQCAKGPGSFAQTVIYIYLPHLTDRSTNP